MADRQLPEIRDLIRQLEDNVRDLDAPETFVHQIEDGSYDYTKDIPSELGRAVPVPSRILTEDTKLYKAAVSWPVRFNVDIAKTGIRAEGQGDELEALFAHSFLRMDPHGTKKSSVESHMVRSRYGVWWFSVVPKQYPKRRPKETNKAWQTRCDEYDQRYWRWALEVVAPSSFSMLDFGGDVTTGAIHDEIGVIDFIDLYGDVKPGDDPDPLTILNKQFPYLRATDGSSMERDGSGRFMSGQGMLRKRVKRWIVDDGVTITHYLEAPSRESKELRDFTPIVESFKNTFGRPSAVLFPGIYRANAPMKTRYEPLIGPLAHAAHTVAVNDSIIETVVANRRWVEPLPEQLAERVGAMPSDVKTMTARDLKWRSPTGENLIPQAYGSLQDVSNVLPKEFFDAAIRKVEEYDKLRAAVQALSPSPETLERSTAAGVLYGAQAGLRPFKDAHEAVKAGYEKVCRMMAHDVVYGLNPHLLTGQESKTLNEKGTIKFSAFGEEQTTKPVNRGSEYAITGSRFLPLLEDSAAVRVELVAETDAQRMAQFQMELMSFQAGMSTPEDVLEAKGVVDVSKKIVELAAWNNIKVMAPSFMNLAMQTAIQRVAIRDQRDPQMIAQMVAGGQTPGNAPPGGGGQVSAPQTTGTPGGPVPMDGGVAR